MTRNVRNETQYVTFHARSVSLELTFVTSDSNYSHITDSGYLKTSDYVRRFKGKPSVTKGRHLSISVEDL